MWHAELPQPGIKPRSPTREGWSLNHWTSSEVQSTNANSHKVLVTKFFLPFINKPLLCLQSARLCGGYLQP